MVKGVERKAIIRETRLIGWCPNQSQVPICRSTMIEYIHRARRQSVVVTTPSIVKSQVVTGD